MKTILHICDWYRPIGGAEKLLFDTLKLLEKANCANIIVFNDHPDQETSGQRPEHAIKGLELFSYHYPGSRLLAKRAIKELNKIIEKYSPDICHIHNFQNSFITEYLLETLPCVRSIHDPRLYCFTNWKLLPDKSTCPYPIGKNCISQGCISSGLLPKNNYDRNAPWVLRNLKVHKRMRTLILESRMQIECLLENGFSPEQIAWLPNFTPIRSEKDVKHFVSNHFKPDERIILFVGRASYEKGAHVLIDACKYIKSDCKIVIITAGTLLEELKLAASAYPDRIKIIPGLSYNETRKYYARSSVIVVPSVWLENFCLVGLEAYANMKPVIGSRIGGIKDWLKDNKTGWFFEPGNARDLAARIDHAMADPEKLKRMGQAAYNQVCKYYNEKLYLTRLLAIYAKGIDKF